MLGIRRDYETLWWIPITTLLSVLLWFWSCCLFPQPSVSGTIEKNFLLNFGVILLSGIGTYMYWFCQSGGGGIHLEASLQSSSNFLPRVNCTFSFAKAPTHPEMVNRWGVWALRSASMFITYTDAFRLPKQHYQWVELKVGNMDGPRTKIPTWIALCVKRVQQQASLKGYAAPMTKHGHRAKVDAILDTSGYSAKYLRLVTLLRCSTSQLTDPLTWS